MVNEPDETAAAPRSMMRFRKSYAPRLDRDQARRQGEITRLAFLSLGRENAIAFLNADNAALCGRPLDLAMASDEGCNNVEAEIGRLVYRSPAAAR